MRLAGTPMADERGGLKREVGRLVGLVLLVHALFIAGYFVGGLSSAPGDRRFGYMVVWTGATLLVVLRGLARVRAARRQVRSAR